MPSVFMTCWETSGSGVKAGLVHIVTMQRLTLLERRPATSTPRVVVVTTATPYMNAPLGEIVTSRSIPPAALASGSPQSREKLALPSISKKPRSFRLGRQSLSSPFCVGGRILIRDLHNRIISFAANIAFGTARVPPVGALHIAPPLQVIVERHRMVGRRKNNAAGK